MGHPYTDTSRVGKELGTTLRDQLLDLNKAGSAHSGTLDAAIEDASAEIDGRIGQKKATPLAGDPLTLAVLSLIATCATYLVCASLLFRRHPESESAKGYRARAEAIMAGIADGSLYLDSGDVAGDAGAIAIAVTGTDPVFAGEDADESERMGDW